MKVCNSFFTPSWVYLFSHLLLPLFQLSILFTHYITLFFKFLQILVDLCGQISCTAWNTCPFWLVGTPSSCIRYQLIYPGLDKCAILKFLANSWTSWKRTTFLRLVLLKYMLLSQNRSMWLLICPKKLKCLSIRMESTWCNTYPHKQVNIKRMMCTLTRARVPE